MTVDKVRLRDVAVASGVSTKTASRVINGDPRVSEETRTRVQEVADTLGYRVDLMARSLRKGVDTVVGIVVPTIGDPFFASIIEEVERIALGRDLHVVVASSSRDTGHEQAVLEGLLARRVAGLIVVPFSLDYSVIDGFATSVVFLDRRPFGIDRDVVLVDDVDGGRLATEHLLARGHRRIAVIGDEISVRTSADRLAGYRQALAAAGVPQQPEIEVMSCQSAEQAARATHRLLSLEDPPTAIFSCRSETSIGIVPALHDLGRTDVAFMSFGDFSMADVVKPGVSVIDHDPRKLAVAAMERLLARLDGADSPATEVTVPLRLIARGSGELLPPARQLTRARHG